MKMINKIYFRYLTITFIMTLLSCDRNKNDFDATGVFEATEVIVSSEANGKIMDFNIEEGGIIESGISVGYVDTIQLHLKKMQLLASKGAVKSKERNIPNQIAALNEQIAKQKKEQKRFQNLVASNAANQKQLDDINSQLMVLQRELTAQTENLTNSNLGVNQESESIEVQVAQLEDQIKKSVITSPIKGTILTKYAEKGELAQQGKALFKIADLSNIFLRVYISSDQLNQLKIGQTMKVYADFGETDVKEYSGTISWISDKSEFTPKTIQTRDERTNLVYAVKIAVKNDGIIKLGMYGEVKF